MFSPFGFMATKGGVTPTSVPPYSPALYFDANNGTYSSLFKAENVVNSGSVVVDNLKGTGTSNSGSDSYDGTKWTYNKVNPRPTLSVTGSATTSDLLRNVGNREHTICTLSYPLTYDENDVFGASGDSGTALLGFNGTATTLNWKGHGWNQAGESIQKQITLGSVVGSWVIGSQRLTNDGGGNATLKVWAAQSGSAYVSGSQTNAYNIINSTGSAYHSISSRNFGSANFSGSISQVVIYDKVLTDGEVDAVHEWMLNHQTY